MQLTKDKKEVLNITLGSDLRFPIAGSFENIKGLDLLLQDIQLLLLTVPGERVGNPAFGCNIRNAIWENIDTTNAKGAAEIKAALTKFESRITVGSVVGTINRQTDLITYIIKFTVNVTQTNVNLVYPYRSSTQLAFS